MKNYLIICKNKIIDIVYDSMEQPVWPPDPDGNPVIAVEYIKQNNEEAEIGMDYLNGKYFYYIEEDFIDSNLITSNIPNKDILILDKELFYLGAQTILLELINGKFL